MTSAEQLIAIAKELEFKEKQLTRYAEALATIAQWKLPETGQFWDTNKKEPLSYEAAYGSNGARDYIRNIAAKALTDLS